jgi:hypothetical protein
MSVIWVAKYIIMCWANISRKEKKIEVNKINNIWNRI